MAHDAIVRHAMLLNRLSGSLFSALCRESAVVLPEA